ncbi:monovalent cation/H+ antiporter subunit D family protein [Microbulbifer agarilyticus]|uniref:proton-conducting transporter transmembrane domain-containing protein n=1 Tax=Microbulbifer agarilyticus TaxID=260552 RepID=UPI001C9549BE|nr:proton-conducting transporter membrane subunit [Microbulbifer agarilyticus]MBY6210291.1 monovalent cation/H+ antiporter subunit D family protein [Microbulbifer agarilyticus]
MNTSNLLQLTLLIPVLALVGIQLTARWENVREAISLIAASTLFFTVTQLYQPMLDGQVIAAYWLDVLPGLALSFRVEPLGLMFALVASFLWIITTLYAIGYMRGHGEKNQARFFSLFAVSIGAVMGIAFAENLFTLFIFYEVLTLCTYPLVTHAGTDKARAGGRVYLGILLGTSVGFFLLAIIATWLLAGTLSFTEGGVFSPGTSLTLLSVLLVLFVFGVGKAAIMPFHRWLPAAMVAPTPVSALLHAVAVVKAGVFVLLKICLLIFGIDTLKTIPATEWLLYLAGVSILLASIIALRQQNLKKRLAYSTVSQLGYITLGALLATSAGMTGSALHIVMHAFGKITLFFCAGAILVAAHKTEVHQLRGLGRQMPVTMTAFLVASLCIIGIPPTGGTWSKWYLMLGTFEAQQWILMGLLMISSLLSIAYLLPIPLRAFFSRGDQDVVVTGGSDAAATSTIKEAPVPSLIALGITAAGCIYLLLFPDAFYQLIKAGI